MVSDDVQEAERLQTLKRYGVLDTPPDQAFETVTRLAASFFSVPVCVISLVDEDRIWFKSHQGLEVDEVSRDPGLCASVILCEGAHIIKDAMVDPRTLSNPLVAGELGLRFYAGVPLTTHDGYRLGSMAVIDFEPREFGEEDINHLRDFGRVVMEQMELRRSTREIVYSLRRLLTASRGGQDWEEFATLCAWSKKLKVGDFWMSFDEFLRDHLGMTVSHGIHPDAAKQLVREEEDKKNEV